MNTNYIDELNESQCAAVTYNDGPSLVIAGAGSGKTRVLTYKSLTCWNRRTATIRGISLH